jgi:hypothetical protein
LPFGTTTQSAQAVLANSIAGNTPVISRIFPSRASSPRKYVLPRSFLLDIDSPRRIPKAIGRSKDGPDFLVSAGARLTVIRFEGKPCPEFLIALRTRSRLSCTAASPSQTMAKAGIPVAISTSTSIRCPDRPWIAIDPITCIMSAQ